LEHVKGTRATQRAERERGALPTVALVGYTNAGKSTLLNALTGAEVGVRDRLFNTLDPTTRTLRVIDRPAEDGAGGNGAAVNHRRRRPSGRPCLLTDTVGFISKLPHQLIDAFGATLEETRRADLLVHVLDASAPAARAATRQSAVEQTLEEIGAGSRPQLLVLNKIDLVKAGEDGADGRDELRLEYPDAVLVSASTGEGLEELLERIYAELLHMLRPVQLLVPYADGRSLAELHALAGEVTRWDTPEGVRVRALVPAAVADRFARFGVG
jgi:GTP-binding protein HflX